ncbi:MAG: beta-glucosidase BglX [Bacteroidaceae bacterium]|nr:beta-glucosidase BglX [Bacteroidaceae bacterium]MBQ9639982.1 beta-glucosidase BglX [Bacteroidaceae bacterium]
MKKEVLMAMAAGLLLSVSVCAQRLPSSDEMNHFVTTLMSRMTLDEKLGQLHQLPGGNIVTGSPQTSPVGKLAMEGKLGSVFNIKDVEQIVALQHLAVEKSRLGIPLLVAMDVIHGYETVFPVPLGLSCTWDMEAVERSAQIAAAEAAANGVAWTFSPMVDIALDSRWGRQAEGAGEDPYMGSQVAAAMVRGYQGNVMNGGKDGIMACVKHFALYGAAEAGLDYNTADMSRLRMYNQYFPPYKAAVEAGAGSIMSSFNIVDGVPATANKWLLTDVLRRQWGFCGMVVTDYASIGEMKNHGLGGLKESAAQALKAGTDMDMCANGFLSTLKQSLDEGTVTMADIDQACRRVLEAKYRLGLFQNPYKFGDVKTAKKLTYCKEHREAARRITAESFVLLKNANGVLPLKKQGTIALIGPLIDTHTDITGSWAVAQAPEKYKSLREGFAEALKGKAKLLCAQGCNLMDNAQTQRTVGKGHGNEPIPFVDADAALAEAISMAREADVVVCAMGECAWMNGEGTSRTDLELYAPQRRLLEAVAELGKPVVLLNFAGRATVLTWEAAHIPAIMNVWYGSECADALCDVLFGDVSPSGHLTVSMPRATGQEPLYYNRLPSGRYVQDGEADYKVFTGNYLDATSGALYPFGYGLTYSSFAYSDVRLSSSRMSADGTVTASVTLTNTGQREATEVVQLYIHDKVASISRPIKELKDFQRVTLKAGESREVKFTVTPDKLKFYNYELQYVLEPGEFDVMIGGNSRELKTATFRVE